MNPRAKKIVALGAGAVMATSVVSTSLATSADAAPKGKTVKFSKPKVTKSLLAAMQKAKPLKLSGPQGKKASSKSTRSTASGKEISIPGSSSRKMGGGVQVNPPASAGKLFILNRDGSLAGYCSANVVVSKFRNVIASASHCLHDESTGTAKGALFVPAYHKNVLTGRALPYGVWAVTSASFHPDFLARSDPDYDQTFANVVPATTETADKFGTRIGTATGQQGMQFNKRRYEGFIWGYPADALPNGQEPFSGEVIKWVYGTAVAAPKITDPSNPSQAADEHWAVKGTLTGGASGGPWLNGYQSAKRHGYQVGATSMVFDANVPEDGKWDYVTAPPYTSETLGVYMTAANTPPPA